MVEETLLQKLSKRELLALTLEMIDWIFDERTEFRDTTIEVEKKTKKNEKDHSFDITKYRQRHIALHLQYDGSKYLGFASSDDGETVESHLFHALTKLRLIESRETSGYSRCGRTDKGVSALGQVVALHLRSAIPLDSLECETNSNDNSETIPSPLITLHPEDRIMCRVTKVRGVPQGGKKKTKKDEVEILEEGMNEEFDMKEMAELDYCQMINRCLPNEIRVIGWTEVTPQFSARFSAISRTYRYFFLRNNLDLTLMNEAAALLIGDHDFRNLCKMDMAHVSNFNRMIYEANISIVSGSGDETVCMLQIKGIAFLWHMVRCIMAILMMVGERKETPDIVTRLLNIEENPSKPEYSMAPDLPLVLHESGFEQLSFKYQPAVLWTLTAHYRALWEEHTLAAIRVKNTLNYLSTLSVRVRDVKNFTNLIIDRTKKTVQDSTTTGTTNRKRSRADAESSVNVEGREEDPNDSEIVLWRDILNDIQSTYSLRPVVSQIKGQKSALCLESDHIPLLHRKKAEDYETKKAHLKGAKRDRLLKHEESKLSRAANSTSEFFSRMRTQGSA